MLLEVHERMQLMQLVPAEGKYEALKTWRRQREMLSFTPEEIDTLGMKSIRAPDGSVRTEWQNERVSQVVKDVPIDEYCTNYFRKKLAELEEMGKLNEQNISLYEKFVLLYR